MELIRDSRLIYYVQVTTDGLIVDANNHFIDSFIHITPSEIDRIVHKDDIRALKAASLRAIKHNIATCQIRTIKSDGSAQWSLWEMAFIKGYFIAHGIELFPAYETGTGELQRQYDFIRKLNFALNHGLRSKLASAKGLAEIMKLDNDIKLIDMLINALNSLDDEFYFLVKKFGRIRK